MSDADIALFRLRAFEHDWVHRLAVPGQERLTAVLHAESRRWIDAGRGVGWFAGEPRATPPEPADDDAVRRCCEASAQEQLRFADAAAFGEALALAQDDLTPERRRYIDLLLFADDAAWERALREVWAYVDAVFDAVTAPTGASPLPPPTDTVRWAISGPESDIDDAIATPARWRAPAGLARLAPDRQAALAEARMLVAEALLAELDQAEADEPLPARRTPPAGTDWVAWVRERLGLASLAPLLSLRTATVRGTSRERLVLRGSGNIEGILRRRADMQLVLSIPSLPADVSGAVVIGFPAAGDAPIEWFSAVATAVEAEISEGWLEVTLGRSAVSLEQLAEAFGDIVVLGT